MEQTLTPKLFDVPDENGDTRELTKMIPVASVIPNRYQPRREFADESMASLTESVRAYGILQPILVRQTVSGKYELIAGERRLRAAKAANIEFIPAAVREYNDSAMGEVALIENIQRDNLNIVDEAMAYARLIEEFGYTQEQLSQKIGRSRSHIANILRLLKLTKPVKEMLIDGRLSMGRAKPLLALPEELQDSVAETIVKKDLTARKAEALVKKTLKEPPEKASPQKPDVFLKDAQTRLSRFLGAKVKIIAGKKKHSLHIDFYSPDELIGLIEILTDSFDRANGSANEAAAHRTADFVV